MNSKTKRSGGIKAIKKYEHGGYHDPKKPESKASRPPGDYRLKPGDFGDDQGRPFYVLSDGTKSYGEYPLQAAHNPLSPAQDMRDILSGVMKFPKSPIDGLTDIALGTIGAVPFVGDAAKAILKPFSRSARNEMIQLAASGPGSVPLDIFSTDFYGKDIIETYTNEARKVTREFFDKEADRALELYSREGSHVPPYGTEFFDWFEKATNPLTEAEISALKKDIKLANNGSGYVNVSYGAGNTQQFNQIPSDVLERRLNEIGKTNEWYLDPVLSKYFGSGVNATDALKETFHDGFNIHRANILEAIHSVSAKNTLIVDPKRLSVAGGALATGAAAYGYSNIPQAHKNALRRKVGLPQDLPDLASTNEKYVDLSNRRLGYVETVPGETPDMEANLILGGEFVEGSENSDTVKNADEYKNIQGSVKLPSINGEIEFDAQSGNYYGVQDNKLLVGDISSFSDDTKVVPLRYSPENISEARVENGKFRIVDHSGNPIYQNIRSAGKIILYSPETGKSAFFYSSSPEKSVKFTNRFLGENNGSAIPVVIDNGRYQYYMDTDDQGTMSGSDYGDYIKNDVNRPYKHGYNLTAYDKGGTIKVLKKDKKSPLMGLMNKYKTGGYLPANGDPTDPKKPESKASPILARNYSNMLYYADLAAKLNPSLANQLYPDRYGNVPNAYDPRTPEQTRLGLDPRETGVAETYRTGFSPAEDFIDIVGGGANIFSGNYGEGSLQLGAGLLGAVPMLGDVLKSALKKGEGFGVTPENLNALKSLGNNTKGVSERSVFNDLNRSSAMDLEEHLYDPDTYTLRSPGWGWANRYRDLSNDYSRYSESDLTEEQKKAYEKLNMPLSSSGGGSLHARLGDLHRDEYGMDRLSLMETDGLSDMARELPNTKYFGREEVGSQLENLGLASTSIPQIKPLQRGGSIEKKFVKPDGTIDLKGLSNYVKTSKDLSEADRFILNTTLEGINNLNVKIPLGDFKQMASEFVPRMQMRIDSQYATYGAANVFGTNPKGRGIAVVLGETNNLRPGKHRNYQLNPEENYGMHYDAPDAFLTHRFALEPSDGFKAPLQNNSHYRVFNLREEPETSYFLEIQSDALSGKRKRSSYANSQKVDKSAEMQEILDEGITFNPDSYYGTQWVHEGETGPYSNLFYLPIMAKQVGVDVYNKRINTLDDKQAFYENKLRPKFIEQINEDLYRTQLSDFEASIEELGTNIFNIENEGGTGAMHVDLFNSNTKSFEKFKILDEEMKKVEEFADLEAFQKESMIKDMARVVQEQREVEEILLDNNIPIPKDLELAAGRLKFLQTRLDKSYKKATQVQLFAQDVRSIGGPEKLLKARDSGGWSEVLEELDLMRSKLKLANNELTNKSTDLNGNDLKNAFSVSLADFQKMYKDDIILYDKALENLKKNPDLLKSLSTFEGNPVSDLMHKSPEKRVINEALHGPYNNVINRFPTKETSMRIQNHEIGSSRYESVHNKYKDMGKTLKSMGYSPELVTDSRGNTWWEVKGTAGMLQGTAEYNPYRNGGIIKTKKSRKNGLKAKKYKHGGYHDPRKEKMNQMLASGMWTEGDNGELIRTSPEELNRQSYEASLEEAARQDLNNSPMPSAERINYLQSLDRPLTKSETAQYLNHALNPSAGPNMLFSTAAGFSNSAASVDVVGGLASKAVKKTADFLETSEGRKLLKKVVSVAPEALTDKALTLLAKRNAGRKPTNFGNVPGLVEKAPKVDSQGRPISSTYPIWENVSGAANTHRGRLNVPTRQVSSTDPEGFLMTSGKIADAEMRIARRHQSGVFETPDGDWTSRETTRNSPNFIASSDMQVTSKPMSVYRAPRQAPAGSSGDRVTPSWETYRVSRGNDEALDITIDKIQPGDVVENISQGQPIVGGATDVKYAPDPETGRGGRYVSTTTKKRKVSSFESGLLPNSRQEIIDNDNLSVFRVDLPKNSPVLRPQSYTPKGEFGFPSENEITLSPFERYRVKEITYEPASNFAPSKFLDKRVFLDTEAETFSGMKQAMDETRRRVVVLEPMPRDYADGGILPQKMKPLKKKKYKW